MGQLSHLNSHARKLLARELLHRSEFTISDNPVAIFMAGLPGAGKTELTLRLLEELFEEPLRIDMDEIATKIEGYAPEKAYLFRRDATAVLEKIFDEAVKKKYWLIMDGTFSHSEKAVSNVQRCVKEGYDVSIYFVHQEPRIAWNFTKAREVVEKRSIDPDGFIATYYHMRDNLRKVISLDMSVVLRAIVKDADNREDFEITDVQKIADLLHTDMSESDLRGIIS